MSDHDLLVFTSAADSYSHQRDPNPQMVGVSFFMSRRRALARSNEKHVAPIPFLDAWSVSHYNKPTGQTDTDKAAQQRIERMAQTVLVADDEPEIVKLVRAYLEEAGYRVVTANDGREALLVIRHEKPDLVVLDLAMPEMDGLEFTRRLRQEKNTPIIMLTARVEETDRIIGLELGADDYVTKPFSPSSLNRKPPKCCALATWFWIGVSTGSP
jgi:CheY-like chemotaxis protein